MLTHSVPEILSKEKVDRLLENQTGEQREFAWSFPAFERPFQVIIQLASPEQGVRPKTVAILNDLIQLGAEQRRSIRRLLYEDALMYRDLAVYGDPDASKIPLKASLWERLIGRHPRYQFIAISVNDPRHPCNFAGGEDGVDAKVIYDGVEIDEQDECVHRLCFLHCTPRWEEEHGRRIVLRNGEPVGLSEPPELLDAYDSI